MRRVLSLVATSVLLTCAPLADTRAGEPSGCSDISSIAPFTQFTYENQFQAIWGNDPKKPGLCTGCHPGEIGAANLGLGNGFSYANLVGVPSVQEPSLLRVNPGNPLASLLFLKLSCDNPGVGGRMPPGQPLSLTQQAFVFDWIRLGAPLSRLGFEDR